MFMNLISFIVRLGSSLMIFSNLEYQKLYLERLHLDPSLVRKDAQQGAPTQQSLLQSSPYEFLCRVTEAHLEHIPFENLAQHGGAGGPVSLDLSTIATKILKRRRGGFCLELNGLLGAFLSEVGFQVTYVPAIVHVPDLGGFDHPPTHLVLVVSLPTNDSTLASPTRYFVDVGFGEPPLHPLRYELDGSKQVTPEGMKSRLVMKSVKSSTQDGVDESVVVLEWWKDGEWAPRLQWKSGDAVLQPGPSLEDFAEPLAEVSAESSNFSRKIIVCRLTRDTKHTLAGTLLKQTGPPRFVCNHDRHEEEAMSSEDPSSPNVRKTETSGLEEIRQVLYSMFGIPLDETVALDLQKSKLQDPSLWAHM